MKKECKVVMLPTEKVSTPYLAVCIKPMIEGDVKDSIVYGDNPYFISDYNSNKKVKEHFTAQHLYILSDDKIENGDWYYDHGCHLVNLKCIRQFNGQILSDLDQKIIATTDESLSLPKPSQQFVIKYYRLGGIDKVMVEYTSVGYYSMPGHNNHWQETGQKLQVSKKNTITTSPVVEKTYPKAVVEILLKRAFGTAKSTGCYLDAEQIQGWINQNLQ